MFIGSLWFDNSVSPWPRPVRDMVHSSIRVGLWRLQYAQTRATETLLAPLQERISSSPWAFNTSSFPLPALCGTNRSRKDPSPLPGILRASEAGRGSAMTFEEILDHAIAMLQRRGCLIYRILQRQFPLENEAI